MAHEVTIYQREPWDWFASCRCGWTPDLRKKYRTEQMVEDEVAKHDRLVEQARLHLRRGSQSLKAERDYYEAMAVSATVTDQDKALWQMLADGLNSRLGKPNSEPQDVELPLTFAAKEEQA